MSQLKNRLDFTQQQLDYIIEQAKKNKKKSLVINYKTGVDLTISLGKENQDEASGRFRSSGFKKDRIDIYPYMYFYIMTCLVLLILPFINPYMAFFTIPTTCFLLAVASFPSIAFRLFPFNLHTALLFTKGTMIHELTHFYDMRVDSLNYNSNFKRVNLPTKNQRYYNEKTEIHAFLVSKLYKIKNRKFTSFEEFYKVVSKIKMFKYLTKENRKYVFSLLDNYYTETHTKKEN